MVTLQGVASSIHYLTILQITIPYNQPTYNSGLGFRVYLITKSHVGDCIKSLEEDCQILAHDNWKLIILFVNKVLPLLLPQ